MKRIIIEVDSSVDNNELIDYIKRKLNLDILNISVSENNCYHYVVIRKVYKERSINI